MHLHLACFFFAFARVVLFAGAYAKFVNSEVSEDFGVSLLPVLNGILMKDAHK